MPRRFTGLFLALGACASGPEPAPSEPEPARAAPPSGAVEPGLGCALGEPAPLLWNPSSTPRRCMLGDEGPFEVKGLQIRVLGDVWVRKGTVPRCEDAPVDIVEHVSLELARLEAPDPSVRQEAAQAIAAYGPAAADLAWRGLASRVSVEREEFALYHAGRALIDVLGEAAVVYLVDAIAVRTDAGGREQLAQMVGALGEAAAQGLVPRLSEPAIADAFDTADVVKVSPEAGRRLLLARREASARPDARALATYLARRPDDAEIATLALEAFGTSKDPKARYRLVEPLSHLRSPAAVGALVRALADADDTVVFKSTEALGILGKASRALTPDAVADAVAALLPTEDETLYWHATMALGRMGRDTPRVRAALAAASTAKDPRIRIIAAAARIQLAGERVDLHPVAGPPVAHDDEALRVLGEGLASAEPHVRGLALGRVEELGPLAAPLVDAVAALLEASRDDLWTSDFRTETLLAMGPAAHPALREVAEGKIRVRLSTWLEVVAALGEAAAMPILERLGGVSCRPREVTFDGYEASIARMRLGAGRAIDRAMLLELLSQVSDTSTARHLTPHARHLGLGEAERTAIAWLAENHADFDARRALARLSAELGSLRQ